MTDIVLVIVGLPLVAIFVVAVLVVFRKPKKGTLLGMAANGRYISFR